MNPAVQHLPLQASGRASFHGDPAIGNALELAARTAPLETEDRRAALNAGFGDIIQSRNIDEFVVVNLDNDSSTYQAGARNAAGGRKGEGSAVMKSKSKRGSLDDDVELGHKTVSSAEGKHVTNGSKDDAADGELVCRVCHLGLQSGNSESIELGCACKQDLALCHRDCAEEWFKIRGNTVCEICGETVKNVKIPEPSDSTVARLEADGVETSTQRVVVRATAMSRLRYLWQRQLIRNSLLGCLIVIFMVPWFFRIAYFTT